MDGTLAGGALSRLCVPLGWNGQLVVFAHGYTAPTPTLGFQNLTLPDGTPVPTLVQSLGFAFATTSYRKNGLAILEGVEDIKELIAAFSAAYSTPLRTHLVGVSEGGLVTALVAERAPELLSSALAACGPIGNFRAQIDYFGDFRVLFDYFFPGVLPGNAISVPAALIIDWASPTSIYRAQVTAALAGNPARALELMRTAKAAIDPANPATVLNTALDILSYNVFATNDAIASLGGNPYDNRLRLYFGSSNDLRLNLRVQRFAGSPTALTALRAYNTSGKLTIPMVTLHTTGDDVIPAWHELLYLLKADTSARGRFIPLPVTRYGHCNFTTAELLGALQLAVTQP